MTGNKNAWRAPLAGLASVAMIATMGVTALSANAVDAGKAEVNFTGAYPFTVTVNSTPSAVGTKYTATLNSGSKLASQATIADGVIDGHVLDTANDKVTGTDGADYTEAVKNGNLVDQGVYNYAVAFKNGAGYIFRDTQGTVITGSGDFAAKATVTVPQVSGTDVYFKDQVSDKVVKSDDKLTAGATGAASTFVQQDANALYAGFNDGKKTVYRAIEKGRVKGEVPSPDRDAQNFNGWVLKNDQVQYVANFAEAKADETLVATQDGTGYWLDNAKIGNLQFNGSVTFTGVWNAKVENVKVKFHYGTYKGAPKDTKTVKVKSNETIAVPSEKPVRDGYLFYGWLNENGAVLDGSKYYKTTVLASVADVNGDGQITFTAVWGKPGKANAEEALKDLPAVSFTAGRLSVTANDSAAKQFTEDSWAEYTEAYKKAVAEYKQADWSKVNGLVAQDTAKSIVAQLNEGRKALRFNTAKVDTTLDGKNTADGAEMVYRLATPDGARHFMTGDENEVLARTGKLTNTATGVAASQGGWKLEPASSFRMVARNSYGVTDTEKTDQGSVDNSLGYDTDNPQYADGLLDLVTKVTRLYNPVSQEHLYTTDKNEVKTLTKSYGWSVDSDAAALYTPALYETGTEVARFYNEKTGLHFYTTDKAEINFWTVQHPGIWQKESTGIYAL